ncbi:NAD-dependent DNA ligase LigA [Nitritalea halalkaliphila]|uniref:NAD-dependent DNA ligase LigA n=1 Tax=Nitritalea halalkaliphila TaxID=590849 RepID=UPI0002D6CE5F|nr:NAD-dependent DNA ligase LigA [Nitritalea halalkaliphila]
MEAAAAREKIQALTEKIEELNHLYYQNNESRVSDQEFDLLLKRLQQLEEAFPELADPNSPTQRVGGTITKNFAQATHQYRMLSLGNTYSPGELQDFDGRVAKGLGHRDYAYCCELKFDGVAISLIYEQGRLVRAVTRGDGTQGDVVTENVKTIRSIPLYIEHPDLPERFEVRGEVFLPRKEFDRINAERQKAGEPLLANPRNAASGTLKMQDSSIVAKRRLDCYCYQLLGENLGLDTHEEATQRLEAWGFHVSPTYKKCADIQEVFAYIEEWEEKRHSLPVDTDGVVLKLNDFTQREELGFTAKIPRWAIAYKYAAESMPTRLLGIQYQVGRTGLLRRWHNSKL